MTIREISGVKHFTALSTDPEPTPASHGVSVGSTLLEEETGHEYEYGEGGWFFKGTIIGNAGSPVTQQNPLPVDSVNKLTISNAIDSVAFDLNAEAFSETTDIDNDYFFDNIVLNFSTAEEKTITITGPDGTILWGGDVDQSEQNLGYNTTAKHFNLIFKQAFNGGDNITVEVTQLSSAGTMDCVLKAVEGTNTLLGNPVIYGLDLILGGNHPLPLDRSGEAVPTIVKEHFKIHEGSGFTSSFSFSVGNGEDYYILLANPAGNYPHIRKYTITSDGAPVDIRLFEEPTVSDAGSVADGVNNNRNSPITPSLVVTKDATITDDGDVVEVDAIVGAKHSGGNAKGIIVEWILDPSKSWVIKVTNNSGGSADMTFNMFWYE